MNRLGFALAILTIGAVILFFSATGESIGTFDNLILSRLGVSEILRFVEASDHDKGLTEEEMAAKYVLGEVPEDRETPARTVMEWKAMPPSEQRQLKVIWFREHYRQISVEEVSKHVDIDYLKARAGAEFRENPLAEAPKPKTEETEKPKKIKIHKPPKKPRIATDTAAVKMGKPKKSDPKKPITARTAGKTPDTAVKPSALKSDTTPPGKPDTLLKKLPWYGLPTRMKNE